MESVTKNRQLPPTLRAMIAQANGTGQVPTNEGWMQELDVGVFNVANGFRLRDCRETVLKIAPPSDVEVMTYERGAMATELTGLSLVRTWTSVPVPAVEFAHQTRQLCDADYFFIPYFDADNLSVVKDDLPPAECDRYGKALGATTAELNSIRGQAFGSLDGSSGLRLARDVHRHGRGCLAGRRAARG